MDSLTLATKLMNRVKNLKNLKSATAILHTLLKKEGVPFIPFGVGNKKTELPGFYRKVGDTCPTDCPYLGKGCYSQGGRTALAQERAVNCLNATVTSFLACSVLSQVFCGGWPSRMFVSGDLYREGQVDRELVEELKAAAEALKTLFPCKMVGYGYSHCHDKSLFKDLSEAGLEILESDYFGPGGTIVYPHSKLDELKPKGFKLVKCPAQASNHKVKCRTCRLCKEARKRKLCIAFDPHGAKKNKLSFSPILFQRSTERDSSITGDQ